MKDREDRGGERGVEHDPKLQLGIEPIRFRRPTDVSRSYQRAERQRDEAEAPRRAQCPELQELSCK